MQLIRNAISEHIGVIIASLLMLSVVLAVVGALGLGSSIGTAVLERRREIGILRTVGASDRTVLLLFLIEGLIIGAISYLGALILSLPLSLLLGRQLGTMAFLTPLPLTISAGAAAVWGLIVALGSFLASGLPASNAVSMTVRDTLTTL